MNSFISHLTGDLTLSHFLAGMLFIGFGLFLTLLLDISQRE